MLTRLRDRLFPAHRKSAPAFTECEPGREVFQGPVQVGPGRNRAISRQNLDGLLVAAARSAAWLAVGLAVGPATPGFAAATIRNTRYRFVFGGAAVFPARGTRSLFLASLLLGSATAPTLAQQLASAPPSSAGPGSLAAGLRACQAREGRECGRAVYADGRISVEIVGAHSRLRWPNLVQVLAAVPGARLELHHSHPADTPLSADDLAALARPGVARVCAYGPTGTWCRDKD